jgi:hypothetical protein
VGKPAKPFVFELWDSEIAQIQAAPAVSDESTFYATIVGQLKESGHVVTLNVALFGQLIRNMSERASDFQLHLFRAFSRSVYGLLAG